MLGRGKTRDRSAVGENAGNAKLTNNEVIEIRRITSGAENRIERGKMYRELAEKYCVSPSCIQKACLRVTFKNI